MCGNTGRYSAGFKILVGVGSGALLRCVALQLRRFVMTSVMLCSRRRPLWRLAALLGGLGGFM